MRVSRCEMYRPPRAHHCRICKRCIRKMDHHCPWINNCVGEWNQKYFLQFLFYVGVLSAYSILLVAVSWSSECPQCPKDIMSKQGRTKARLDFALCRYTWIAPQMANLKGFYAEM